MIDIKYELTHKDTIVPYKSNEGDLGYDIYPAFDADYIEIKPHSLKLIPTGIKSALEDEYGIIFKERSGLASKGIKINAGVIDSSYRGEWKVALFNTTDKPVLIAKHPEDWSEDEAITLDYNDAITQFVILPSYNVQPELVNNVSEYSSERGIDGFGSTDSK